MNDYAIGIHFPALANVRTAFVAYLNQIHGKNVQIEDIGSPCVWERIYAHKHSDEFFRLYFAGMTPPVLGAREAIDTLRRRYDNITVFVSNCSANHVDMIRAWLLIHFNWRPTISFVPEKPGELAPIGKWASLLGIQAYIDDDSVFAQEVAFYDGAVSLLHKPWNELDEVQLITRNLGWEELPDQILQFQKVA